MGNRIGEIVYKTPDSLPPMVNELRLLAATGYRVDVLCADYHGGGGVAYPDPVKIESVESQGHSWWRFPKFVWRAFAQSDPQTAVYVGHDMHGFLVARLLAWRYRRPLIYRCHDLADRSLGLALGGRLVRIFESFFARTADVVVIPDRDRAEAIAKILGLKRTPIVVANAPISAPEARSDALRSVLHAGGHHFERILFRPGAIVPHQAIEATVRSIPLWADKAWGFVVMGWTRPEFEQRITALATDLGVRDQVVLLPPIGYDQVASFTLGADAGHALYEPAHINNRLMGSASNKTMEYLAAGIPIVASDTPEMRRLLESSDSTLFADPASAEDIARAINMLFGDEPLLRRLGAGAQRAFEETFRFDRQFAPLLAEIDRLAGITHQQTGQCAEALS